MPRKFRKSKRKQTVSDAWIIWACDGDILPEPDPRRGDWLEFEYFASDKELEECWRQDGERAIREWLKTNPAGTRPANYWEHALPYAGERRYGADLASPFLEDESEAEYLNRHGLLLKGERA
ncbi:hypothetical protein [Mesorhizobium sp. LjNodule214]|uniref:hypothetical protein n=1 Tax=Mesorhizobium sp. LjNodule214 TaxID=3342252 RepID=UPI003ECEF4DE